MDRTPGWSVRVKLTVSYAGFLLVAGVVLLGAMAMFLAGYRERAQDGGAVVIAPSGTDLLREFAPAAAGAMVFLLVFGLVGGWILAGRMLRPLTRITAATRKAATGSLSHRIALPGPQDEFGELADSFDMMLAALEAQVAEQQRFAANASHELRTPLAITKTLLDLARNDPHRAGSEIDERLRIVNTRAIELTEALLLLSRAGQRSFTGEDVDLSLIVEEAVETLLPLAERVGVTVEVSGQVTPAVGSHTLLLQLIMNLLHNAIVHNRAEEGHVTITTSVGHGAVMIIVENTGQQIAPEVISTLTEPFQRGTARIRTDDVGVGLGLAIVQRITQAHEGTLSLSPRPGGGLRVVVQLPAARLLPRTDPASTH
ncbi:MAG: HAMP domain-containing histidine kinase [Propionibacteriales bacterium]|nr:HAMP domain-containing histidine kinase [Propionibacteriales bacterium]